MTGTMAQPPWPTGVAPETGEHRTSAWAGVLLLGPDPRDGRVHSRVRGGRPACPPWASTAEQRGNETRVNTQRSPVRAQRGVLTHVHTDEA